MQKQITIALLLGGAILIILASVNILGTLSVTPATPQPEAVGATHPIFPTTTPDEATPLAVSEPSPSATPSPTITNSPTPTPTPTSTPVVATVAPTDTSSPTATVEPTPSLTPTAATPPLFTVRERFGVGIPVTSIFKQEAIYQRLQELGVGWYLNWSTTPIENAPPLEFAPMVRLQNGKTIQPALTVIAQQAAASPGRLWLVGNEPDVKWQDNVLPADYARLYNQVYTTLKAADPTCQIAIGGISQPTPLRLQYLELILASYQQQFGQPMPIDVWNIHAFVLHEELDSWGIDIPPGISAQQGQLFEIDDSDNLQIFKQQIIDFRRWLVSIGQANKPLIVTEYGILMPPDYGFGPDRVAQFMTATFDFFLTATDPTLGYAPDQNRLVQRWVWYSLNDPELYITGNLIEQNNGEFNSLGQTFSDYVKSHR